MPKLRLLTLTLCIRYNSGSAKPARRHGSPGSPQAITFLLLSLYTLHHRWRRGGLGARAQRARVSEHADWTADPQVKLVKPRGRDWVSVLPGLVLSSPTELGQSKLPAKVKQTLPIFYSSHIIPYICLSTVQ